MGFQDKPERNQKVLDSSRLVSPGQSNQKATHVNVKHRFLCEVTSAFVLLRSALRAESALSSPSLFPMPPPLTHTHSLGLLFIFNA